MSRYYSSSESKATGPQPEDKAPGAQVFTIGASDINKAKRDQQKKKRKKDFTKTDDQHRNHGKQKRHKKGPDMYPGKAPVDPKRHEKYKKGSLELDPSRLRTKWGKKRGARHEEASKMTSELATRSELLLDASDQAGFLEGDDVDEFTGNVTQVQIREALKDDEEAVAKGFELHLAQFGPYKCDYTRNGRHLVLGGRRGHVAAIEWLSKKLMCEINVQESVHDVKWLHTENMFAVAQKKWTYIYDNQGIELHCLKRLDSVAHLEFLPYHFLLATGNTKGYISWVDVSVGKMVAQFNTLHGPLGIMCQNPANAVLCAGHNKGIVTMWTPNQKEPAAKMLAHRQPVRAVAVDRGGNYLATAGLDRSLRLWDIRMFKMLRDYQLRASPTHLEFSGRGLLAAAMGNVVEVYKNPILEEVRYPYLTHKVFKSIHDVHFVPHEDVMGIGHAAGFSSILVPGSGDANFDALEVNPYQTKTQRREAEVKALLEKIQPELISLDPNELASANLPSKS